MTGKERGLKIHPFASIWDIPEGPSLLPTPPRIGWGFCHNQIKIQCLPQPILFFYLDGYVLCPPQLNTYRQVCIWVCFLGKWPRKLVLEVFQGNRIQNGTGSPITSLTMRTPLQRWVEHWYSLARHGIVVHLWTFYQWSLGVWFL